jgi:hypothetical protein
MFYLLISFVKSLSFTILMVSRKIKAQIQRKSAHSATRRPAAAAAAAAAALKQKSTDNWASYTHPKMYTVDVSVQRIEPDLPVLDWVD